MHLSGVVLGRCFVIIVTFLTLQNEVSGVGSSRSICSRKDEEWVTRRVSYRETYKKPVLRIFWKTATRINYRVEYHREWVYSNECCYGFRMVTYTPLTCKPICPTGCPHGECIEPYTCRCVDGYGTPSSKNLSSCVPICKPDCGVRGVCYEPNKCRCDAGYRLAVSDSRKCEPICQNACVNGVCASPNNCVCFPGYKRHPTISFVCKPLCNTACINANCTGPDHCECYAGYEKTKINPPSTCSPICDPKCINGACTHPDHCECHRGYKIIQNNPNICAPICNPTCMNATCTQPDTCECYIGYGKNPNGPHHECSPICDPPCIHGECTQPNHCECHHRYKTDPDHPEVCLPVCDPPCTNAVCVEPDTCECLDGYEKSTEGHSQVCSPICDPPCVNANCSRPNHCECHHGYELNSADTIHECSPLCNPPCTNAICYKPNVCQCHSGYKNSLKDLPQHCSPVCDPSCDSNGFCESPNKCTCNDGYIEADSITNSTLKNSIICEPFCQPECNKNASCIAPNLCACNPGYQPVFSSDQVVNPTQCLPICEKDCLNGFCGYPNECICRLGYKISQVDKFKCEPHCKQDCINAKCSRPNYCECLDGYEKTVSVQSEPDNNSSIIDNICIPRCSDDCLSCMAPNQCTCHPGYTLRDSVTNPSSRSCQPLCEPACPTGLECIAPNQCKPLTEFGQNDNESTTTEADVSNSTENCPNGGNFINENETCICKAGWSGSGCDKPLFCMMRFMADNETDDQFYTTLSDAIENDQIKEEYEEFEEAYETLGWQAPKCNEGCRISILASDTKNLSNKINHCHRQMVPNVINDSVTTENTLLVSDTNNTSIVCFIKAESKCSSPGKQTISINGSLYGVSGAVGSGVCVITLVLVGLVSFIVLKKKRNAKGSHAVSPSNSILTGWADDPNQNSKLETSTL